jgi:Spy/CpxP family protein refolding chaperone
MTRSNLLAVISFAAVFAAGLFIGQRGWGGARGDDAANPSGSWLASHLDLNSSQREAVRKIWSEQFTAATDPTGRWLQVERDRDAKVRAILTTAAQQKAYDEIVAWHRAQAEAFRSENARLHRKAEEQTRAILSPPQRDKFERLVADHARLQISGARPPTLPVGDVRPADARPETSPGR